MAILRTQRRGQVNRFDVATSDGTRLAFFAFLYDGSGNAINDFQAVRNDDNNADRS